MFRRLLFSLMLCSAFLNMAVAEDGDLLVQDVRRLVGQDDSTANYTTITNAEIRRYLTAALIEVTSEGLGVQADTFYTGGSESNALPSGYYALAGPGILMRNGAYVNIVPVVSPDSLYRMGQRPTIDNMGWDNHYMISMGNRLWFLPSVNANDSVKVTYYKRPSTTIDTSQVAVDDEWERVAVYTAAAWAYANAQDWNGYDRMMARRTDLLNTIRMVRTVKPTVSPQKVP